MTTELSVRQYSSEPNKQIDATHRVASADADNTFIFNNPAEGNGKVILVITAGANQIRLTPEINSGFVVVPIDVPAGETHVAGPFHPHIYNVEGTYAKFSVDQTDAQLLAICYKEV